MFTIPTADSLIDFIKDFTGSKDDAEIKRCIFMAEMSMRNIELPALRCDPYAPENIGVADANGRIPIPGDMNKPILFFKQGRQFITNATVNAESGSTTLTFVVEPQQSLTNGMLVTGFGIAAGTTVVNIQSATPGTVEISIPTTEALSNSTVSFNTTGNTSSQTGPWIVYDRIGDRDIITQSMIAQLYLQPVNVPAVIRGKFSEVGQMYEFLPYIAEGDLINLYYYKAWPLLFSPVDDQLASATGTVSDLTGLGPWLFTLQVEDSSVFESGNTLKCTSGTGSFPTTTTVDSIVDSTHILCTSTDTIPHIGTVTDIFITNLTVQNNAVLATWPEGYVYATLREYYIKRHNPTDAQVYQLKFDDAWSQVEDQNNKGKWSGGHTRFVSVWQPRQYRQYNIK